VTVYVAGTTLTIGAGDAWTIARMNDLLRRLGPDCSVSLVRRLHCVR
jgi:hypothetical protein